MDDNTIPLQEFKASFAAELEGNILPFWLKYTPDRQNGGFFGALSNDRVVHNEVPRSAVLGTRILWTFSAATRLLGKPEYLELAQWAFENLKTTLWDRDCRGVVWSVDYRGNPVSDRKHSYAQAFAIYGLSEYYSATRDETSLRLALELFNLLEAHAHDLRFGGYVEGCSRDWGALEDMRLSQYEINCRKSMNTLLHLLEAFTNLLRVWDDTRLRLRLRELIDVFLKFVIDPRTHHFRLFFDDDWTSLDNRTISYGHDIEGSWLLVEAAQVLGDADLIERTKAAAIAMAQAVYDEGRNADGSLANENHTQAGGKADRHWWVQTEAVVGFYNAYELTGQPYFSQASYRCWEYIREHFVDHAYGDWFKMVDPDGAPKPGPYKVGPWECPYHHSRVCYEMAARLST